MTLAGLQEAAMGDHPCSSDNFQVDSGEGGVDKVVVLDKKNPGLWGAPKVPISDRKKTMDRFEDVDDPNQ